MTRITREAFVNTLVQEGGGLDVAGMSAQTKTALTNAGLDARKLGEIAGRDGKITTRAEYDRLFTLLDGLDHNGSRHSVDTSIRCFGMELQTASGRALGALMNGLAEQRLSAHLGSAAPVTERAPALPSGGPPWLDIVRGELGQKEIPGKESNPRIVEYLNSSPGKHTTDKTPWCSGFANWVMQHTQLNGQAVKGTDSLAALSWLKWGQALPGPALGAVAVIDWHDGGRGHVGFVVGRSGDSVVLAGGNQGDAVQLRTFKLSQITSFRVPTGYQVPPQDYSLPQMNVRTANQTLASTR